MSVRLVKKGGDRWKRQVEKIKIKRVFYCLVWWNENEREWKGEGRDSPPTHQKLFSQIGSKNVGEKSILSSNLLFCPFFYYNIYSITEKKTPIQN